MLPMVTVIQLPPKPEQYSKALFDDGWFDTLSVSAEDIRRSALYEQRAQAEAFRESSTDLDGFYRDLDMTLCFSPVNGKNLSRASQLTQKTNQFNVTTRRYSEGDIARCMNDPTWILVVVSVTDRFGDNGIVGLVMAYVKDNELIIDTFLLSCRVIGRTVETAMLAYLCEAASSLGATSLRGEIIPTQKNTPVRGLFESHGFARESVDESGTSIWRLNCKCVKVDYPKWFKLINDKYIMQY
jgi:FkbH-like protein